MGWLWSWGSMGRIETDIALESWLFRFWPCSGWAVYPTTMTSDSNRANPLYWYTNSDLGVTVDKLLRFHDYVRTMVPQTGILVVTTTVCRTPELMLPIFADHSYLPWGIANNWPVSQGLENIYRVKVGGTRSILTSQFISFHATS